MGFWDCNKVSISTIPQSVIKIGRQAFTCCEGITTLIFKNNMEVINDRCFLVAKT